MNIFMHNIINKMKRSEQVDDRFDIIRSYERSRHLPSTRNGMISDYIQPRKLNKKVWLFLSRKNNFCKKEETHKSIDKIEYYMKK